MLQMSQAHAVAGQSKVHLVHCVVLRNVVTATVSGENEDARASPQYVRTGHNWW